MKTATLFPVLLLVMACSGKRAADVPIAVATVGYVDMNRVTKEATHSRTLNADLQQEIQRSQREVTELFAAADKIEADKKANPGDAKAARQRAQQVQQQKQAEVDQRQSQVNVQIGDDASKAAAAIAGERRLSLVLAQFGKPLFAASSVDLTSDVIKRMDAARDQAGELQALRAEVEQLKASRPPPPQVSAQKGKQ